MNDDTANNELIQGFRRAPKRYASVVLAASILFAACGSDASETDADDTADTVVATVVVADDEAQAEAEVEAEAEDANTAVAEPDAAATGDEPTPPDGDAPEDGGGPPDGEGGPPRGGAGGPPPDGAGGSPEDGAGGPPPDAAGGDVEASGETLLSTGPQNVGEHGPFSNADFDNDGAVTRAELDEFMDGALEREIGLVAFFDLYDADGDEILSADEQATVDPAYAFDGADADEVVSAEEIEVAHESGLLARF